MDVVLVIVGDDVGNLAAFDDFDGVVLVVPPTAHDARTHLQREHRRSAPLRRVGLRRRLRAVDGVGFSVAGGGSGAVFRGGWCLERTHDRERER